MKDAKDTSESTIGSPLFHGMPREPFKINEDDTVTRFVPRMVKLTLPDHTQRVFRPGLQEIPRELADHQWLKDNGVVEYEGSAKLPPLMPQAQPGTQAYAASVGQSGVYDATMVPNYRVSDAQVAAADSVAKMAADHVAFLREQLTEGERVATAAAQAAFDARRRASENRTGGVDDGRLENDPRVQEAEGDNNTETPEEIRAARYAKLTDKMKEDYDKLETDEERDEFLTSKGR